MPVRTTPWPPGTPCWVDLGAPDLPAAQTFYGQLLGWTCSAGEPEFGGYCICRCDGHDAAGLGPQMEPSQPPRWTTYFATDDADRTAAAVTEAGGTVVVAPMDVGPVGRMAIALDPQGQPFGLWQSGLNTGIRYYDEPGGLIWNELASPDPQAARRFYAAAFGFRYDAVEAAEGYTTFATAGPPLGGLGGVHEGGTPGWATCFAVADTDAAVHLVQERGGELRTPPTDTPYGRFAVVVDPWGAPFSVMAATSPGSV